MTLKELRKAYGWDQRHLASALHVDRSAISKWERGIHAPDRQMCQRIAVIFDKTYAEIDAMFIKGGK